jgi:predicted DCC family thiol-disulfide oxidoreductase YuxK
MSGQDVLLYDGVCALCNGLVQFVLPRDPQGRFRFASLQSDFGHAILLKYKFNADDLNTFYAIVDYGNSSEHALNKSAAAFHVLSHLEGPWRVLSWFKILPQPLTDFGYDLIAKNRYRMFGKHDSCMMPDSRYQDRFIQA